MGSWNLASVFDWGSRQELLLLALLVGLGALLGRVRLAGAQLGAAGVLFLSLGLGAWADMHGHALAVPEVLGALGLTLFTFTIGITSGPGFFASLRRGLGSMLAVVAVLIAGAGVAVGLGQLLGLDGRLVAGAFAGALTNTPALAAAREAAGQSALPTLGYAVTYPFGVLGMLLAASLALQRRATDHDLPAPLVHASVRVETPLCPSIRELEQRHAHGVRFSRVQPGGSREPMHAATDADVLCRNDLVEVVGPANLVERVALELGHVSSHELVADRSTLDFRRVTLSNQLLAGHTLAELDLARRFGATVTRVRRGDVDMLATHQVVLQPGDRLRLVAPPDKIAAVSAYFGDSERGTADINPVALGLGLALGIGLGKLALPLPGATLAIGSAAGTLLVGLVFGRLGRVGPLVTTMSNAAAQALGELGLLIFLAQAGTRAGGLLGEAFASGAWLKLLLLGAVVTATVAAGVYAVMRRGFGMGGTRLSGVLAGTQTQPAVLAFANVRTAHDGRVAQGYALVYPAAMIAKILLGQVLGGWR
jgi:putative transport protein